VHHNRYHTGGASFFPATPNYRIIQLGSYSISDDRVRSVAARVRDTHSCDSTARAERGRAVHGTVAPPPVYVRGRKLAPPRDAWPLALDVYMYAT
jgi:hypothetical protein